VARGVAIAITSKAVGLSGSLRALCQSANMDFELTRDLLRSEPMVTTREIPRLAAMVRLLRPVALRHTGTPAVEALLRAVESTHRCVRGHSERTAHLAECLANAAGMTAGECRTARMAGLLHDVGKMGIPEQVLSKPGSLTAEERSLVNMHPEIGHRIVQGVGGLEHAVPAVLWHHERWDGAGYPHRLSGEAIPKIARVMAIVDSYDAMRSDRPYRQALSPEHALREIHCGSGKQFDPALSQAFVRLLGQQPALAA
jgi:HD-GYP domain-containing protein (c-di-GMP phosphodiesterase class II)